MRAEHPERHCVALTSAGGSAEQGLSTNSARRRARRSRIHEEFCRSCNASLLHSRCNGKDWHQYTLQKPSLFWIGSCKMKPRYLHNWAGVASLFAALAYQECSLGFALKHLLRLRAAHFSDKPESLVLMRQVLLIFLQDIGAGTQTQYWFNTSPSLLLYGALYFFLTNSLVKTVTLSSEPVVYTFLPDTFVVQPAAKTSVANINMTNMARYLWMKQFSMLRLWFILEVLVSDVA